MDYRYHCLAEDLGTIGRDPTLKEEGLGTGLLEGEASSLEVVQSAADTCKVVEYASCDIWGETGVRWKPWMDPNLLHGKLVCRFPPTEAFWRTHARWLALWETTKP